MGKIFSALKNQVSSLITILVIFTLGAYYFFIYVPNNEKIVQERHFRCLQNIDNNIREKIKSSVQLIGNILKTNPKTDSIPRSAFDNYKSKLGQLGFVLLEPDEAKAESTTSKPLGLDDTAYTTSIKVDTAAQALFLFVKSNPHKMTGKMIGMRFEFNGFIKPLLPQQIFDGYVIFVGQTKLYESFATGLNYDKKGQDSLLQVNNKIITPGVRELSMGGADYRIFAQPAYTYTKDQWVICGLVSSDSYRKEKDQLPVSLVEFLLTAAIIILVLLPWIKLYHMGNKEKLAIRDGIASLLSSMILMSLIFFVFFKYNIILHDKLLHEQSTYVDSDATNAKKQVYEGKNDKKTGASPQRKEVKYPRSSYSRNMLANQIISAFEKEVDNAYLLLKEMDTTVARGKEKDSTTIKIKKNAINRDSIYENIVNKCPNIQASQFAWINNNNGLVSIFATLERDYDIDIPMNSDLSDREYFKKVKAHHFNRTSPEPFYLDQVISRSSNLFESIIAKRSSIKGKTAVMTFIAKSLDSVVMPDGFQFAVINSSGEVLYHSIPDRNLNENLKEEFADSTQLVSCLEAKSDTSFSEKYYGRLCNIKVKPFTDLPYFTVIFEDSEYNDSRDTQSFVFTLGMLLFLLFFLVIQFAVIFFASAKRSFFKRQWYDISWVGPKVSSHHQYNLAIICNIVIIIFLVVFFEPNRFLGYLYILLFSVILVSIFLNLIFAQKYKGLRPYLYRFKILAIRWLCLFVVLINVAVYRTLKGNQLIYVIACELLMSIAVGLLFFYGSRILFSVNEKLGNWHPKWTYTHSFALMTTTRLIITSGVPVAFFFICSFNKEIKLDTRYRQLKFVKALAQKINFVSAGIPYNVKYPVPADTSKAAYARYYHNTPSLQDDSIAEFETRFYDDTIKLNSILSGPGVYRDLLFVNTVSDTGRKKKPVDYNVEDFLTTGILSAFRFNINSIEVKNNNMNLPAIDDSASFSKFEPDGLTWKNRYAEHFTRTFFRINPDEYIKVSSGNITYIYPAWYSWFILGLAILIFYTVIHRVTRKLFALDLPSTEKWDKIDEDLIANNQLNNLLFIVGSPGSRKLFKLKERIKAGKISGYNNTPLVLPEKRDKGNVFVADMILIPSEKDDDNYEWGECKRQALDKDCALVIINHFEYNIKDPNTNSAKLDFLESLMHQDSSKVIIISTVHPVSFLDSFNNSDSADEKPAIPQSELERWHVLLGHYRIVIEPLSFDAIPENTESLQYLMMTETEYGYFLNKMRAITLIDAPTKYTESEIGPLSDSLIFKLQITSQYFYTYIWQSLTKEEKLLLYDLAEDGLVNPYDDHNLCMLIAKGLVIRSNGTLMLFNKGFRNFILTAIGNTEAKRIKEQVKDNGNWGALKTPLNLVILAILFFLILSEQESYSRIITYITTVGAGFSAIIRIFPALGTGDTQKTP